MNKAIGTIFIIAEVIVALHANVAKPKEDCQTCCELPNTFANGQLRTVSRNTRGFRIVPSGSVLQFKCDDQYLLTGAKRVTCNDGVWSSQLPVCVALHANLLGNESECTLPIHFANGKLRTVKRESRDLPIVPEGSVLQFKCDDGYELVGASIVTCKHGVWFPQLPVCAALRANLLKNDSECTLPIDFANGKLRTVKRESRGLPNVPKGSVLQFKCNDGYELVGASIVTCKHGLWFPQLPVCAALRANLLGNDTECKLPIDFANGQLRTVKRESRGLPIVPEGSVLQFKCHDGYKLEGASRVICRHGVWLPQLPICAVLANHTAISKNENECNDGLCCGMPANFTNGKVIVNSNSHGGSTVPEFSSLQFSCDVGYTIHPTDTSLCLQGNWLPKLPSCVSVNCPPPPPLDNGRIIFDSEDSEFRPGTRISYECENDYTLIKESVLVCARDDGESIWVGELPKCKAKIRCEDPGEDPNGERRGPCCDEGDVVNYVCTEDYDIIGPSAIICTEAEIWNDTKPTCQPEVFCPVPDFIRNGQIKQIKAKGRGGFYLPDDEIMIICDEGYTVGNESDYLYCETNGQWDDEIPKCKSTVNCDVPEPPENGYILELLHDKNITEFPYNFEINFICNPGYRLIGDSWRSCGEDGWKNEIPKCEEIQCPYPGRPDNGWIQGTDYQIGNITFFGCYSGGTLLGSAKRVCLENGQWSGELARCNNRDNYCPNPGIPTGGRRFGSSYDLGAKVTFQCDIGRILTGSANRTCQENRKWSGEETKCFGEHDFDNKKLVGKKIKSILSEETMNQEVKMDNFKSSYERNGSELFDDRARAIDLNFPGRLIFMFIFDVSGSIGNVSFKRSIEFAKAMVKTVKVTEDGVRVGAITFSNKAEKEFYPMDYSTTEDVLEALDKIKHKKGGTAASSALTLLQQMIPLIMKVLGRKSKIIAFVITDGKANMDGNPANDATKLKDSGVEIYCIGITGDRRMQTLYDIASSRKEHVFILDSYESLNWLVQDIVNDTIDYSKCGLRQSIIVENKNEDKRGRAIGGKKVVKPWPWMAVIFTVDPVEKDTTLPLSVCGGSIIDRKWILTAAHCMHQKINDEIIWKNKDEIIIHFGLTDLRNKTYIQERLMLRYITHPLYDPKTFDYDIALIEIERPLVYKKFVRPVCLPPSENDLHEVPKFYRANEEAKAVGWGHTTSLKEKDLSNARHVDISRSVSLPLQERETCQNSLKNRPKNNIFTDQMICAGGNGKDTCRGDSGGPLMQELTDEFGEEYWTQVGIISWGYECGQRGVYGFYTKVSIFKEWIKDITKSE